MTTIEERFHSALADKRATRLRDFWIVTDGEEYPENDLVAPIYPDQEFFLDEIAVDKIQGVHALQLGAGAGELAMGAIQAGASRVTILETDPRAKALAGFNITLNGFAGAIDLWHGDADDVFKPVAGQTFDYIFAHKPFEAQLPGEGISHHSELEKILAKLDEHLSDNGHAQFITNSPGDAHTPFLMTKLIEHYLSGQALIVLNPANFDIQGMMAGMSGPNVSEERREIARQMTERYGVTHGHLFMIHYQKGPKQLDIVTAEKAYPLWYMPLP